MYSLTEIIGRFFGIVIFGFFKEDMQSVAKAIRLGVEFATLDIENND